MATVVDEAEDFLETSPTAWHKELESLLTGKCSKEEVLSVCKGRPLPPYLRNFVWQHCLNLHDLRDPFIQFDGVCEGAEGGLVKKECALLIEKMRHLMAEGDLLDDLDDVTKKYALMKSDVEAVVALYCKRHNATYVPQSDWMDILAPLLLCDLLKCDLYNVFESLLEFFVVREPLTNRNHFVFFRLLLLYHDPQLCTFFDTNKIFPELYASKWFSSLFSHHPSPHTTLLIWDVCLQHNNPHLVFFLALVILVNARDEIMGMDTSDKQAIIEKISLFPRSLEPDDVEDFCSLALYYLSKTPSSFGERYHELLFKEATIQQEHLPQNNQKKPQQQQQLLQQQKQQLLQQQLVSALCLQTSFEELISHSQQSNHKPDSEEAMAMMAVDCRSADHYKRGHLCNAQHLNSHLMLQNPDEFSSRVQAMLTCVDVESSPGNNINISSLGGEHLCFLGYGACDVVDEADRDDGQMNMVVSHFLHRQVQYVSMCLGGYRVLHDHLVGSGRGSLLVGHNNKSCHLCNRKQPPQEPSPNKRSFHPLTLPQLNDTMISERFGRLTSAFKVTSGAIKDKVIGIIKNEPLNNRHVSAADKLGRGYRNMASVFTIDDDEDDTVHSFTPEDEVKEVVVIADWLAQHAHANSVYECFDCIRHPVNAQKPSLLCLNDNHLIVLHKLPDDKSRAVLQTKRSLSSILKITSKKKQPELITIKYAAAPILLLPTLPSPTTPAAEAEPAVDTGAGTTSGKASVEGGAKNGENVDGSEKVEGGEKVGDEKAEGGKRVEDEEKDKDDGEKGQDNEKVKEEEKIEKAEKVKEGEKVKENGEKVKEGEKVEGDANEGDVKESSNEGGGQQEKEGGGQQEKEGGGQQEKEGGGQQEKQQSDYFFVNDSTSITAIDRLWISRAGDATKDIKMHIMRLLELAQ